MRRSEPVLLIIAQKGFDSRILQSFSFFFSKKREIAAPTLPLVSMVTGGGGGGRGCCGGGVGLGSVNLLRSLLISLRLTK